jgi:hypothetical protein
MDFPQTTPPTLLGWAVWGKKLEFDTSCTYHTQMGNVQRLDMVGGRPRNLHALLLQDNVDAARYATIF